MLTIKRLGNGPSYRLMDGNFIVFTGTKKECEEQLKNQKKSTDRNPAYDGPMGIFTDYDYCDSVPDRSKVDVTDPNYLSLLALPFSNEACPTVAEGPYGFHMVNWSENLKKLIVSPVPLSVEMVERRLAFHRSL